MKRTSKPAQNAHKRKKQDIPSLTEFKDMDYHRLLDASVDYGASASVDCTVVFRNLEKTLIAEIEKCGVDDFIFVAVAWLTNETILSALIAAKERKALVLVVVQKEDFLRPDADEDDFKARLRSQYSQLGSFNTEDSLEHILRQFFVLDVRNWGWEFDDTTLQKHHDVAAVRCVGNYNAERSPSFPRMHNKFVVFGKHVVENKSIECDEVVDQLNDVPLDELDAEDWFVHGAVLHCSRDRWIPEKVWTGSFNFSHASVKSFENALLIKNVDIATAYAKEFVLLFLLSEPLNWESTWMAPTFTFQT